MNDAYRTPGRDIDETAIETARIREAGETQRKSIEEREKTRRTDIENRDAAGYILPRVVAGIVALGIIIAAGTVGSSYVEARKVTSCHDESYSKEYRSSLQCTHPLHVYTETDKERACRCGVARLP